MAVDLPVCVIEPVFWVSLPVADFEDVCVAVGVGEPVVQLHMCQSLKNRGMWWPSLVCVAKQTLDSLSCLATMAPASGSHPGQADATEDSDSSMAAVLIADIWSFISKL